MTFLAFSSTVEEKAKWLFEKLKGEGFYTIALPSIFNFPCCSLREDILTKALNSNEHGGRVRGIGANVTPSSFFKVARGKVQIEGIRSDTTPVAYITSKRCDSKEFIGARCRDHSYIDYLFWGDYVDRGQHSLETITLLLALKIEYPHNIHLIRGNHEATDINALFGFRTECIERMGEQDGIWAWHRINRLFNWLPLAALMEKKVICMHGGIGHSINHVEQIENLQRPITMETGTIVLMDLLCVEGLRPNARGPGLVTFGLVIEFCNNNDLQLIVRARECVMDGFERFAQGHLITLFSATNYSGTTNNTGSILVLGRDLVVAPELIHPLPPAFHSPETSSERHIEDTWIQVLKLMPTYQPRLPEADLKWQMIEVL
ncbi:hypothetical protein ZIOFF_038600 [Zingiber officinale]|uniref:Serine/threonine-protein phosphatase n=1 Tax=Zingiber officinale TaxID=94328 RepID=A0A8J5L310_ZINOF|nr:hypothetical protein ZIOFF_038600 [Zingiber officinale]